MLSEPKIKPDSKQIIFFLVGCICTRVALSLVAKNASDDVLQMMGLIALIPAISFIYMFFNNDKKNGSKGFSGATIWWNSLRPVHSFLLLLFAYHAFNKNENAWLILVADGFIGLSAWYLHYYQSIDF